MFGKVKLTGEWTDITTKLLEQSAEITAAKILALDDLDICDTNKMKFVNLIKTLVKNTADAVWNDAEKCFSRNTDIPNMFNQWRTTKVSLPKEELSSLLKDLVCNDDDVKEVLTDIIQEQIIKDRNLQELNKKTATVLKEAKEIRKAK